MRAKKVIERWFVYMVECSDQSIYTGISNDVEARIAKHNSGEGAKYTKGRTPVILRAQFEYKNRSEASKAEFALKRLSKEEKLRLIKQQ